MVHTLQFRYGLCCIFFCLLQPFWNVDIVLSLWAVSKQAMGCSVSTSGQEDRFLNLLKVFRDIWNPVTPSVNSPERKPHFCSLQGAGPNCLQPCLVPRHFGNVSRLFGGRRLICPAPWNGWLPLPVPGTHTPSFPHIRCSQHCWHFYINTSKGGTKGRERIAGSKSPTSPNLYITDCFLQASEYQLLNALRITCWSLPPLTTSPCFRSSVGFFSGDSRSPGPSWHSQFDDA